MHKKGTAVRQRQKAAPALTASPRAGGARPPDPPRPAGTPGPATPALPPYLRRRPQARIAPGRGAAVVIHEEGPAGLRVDLDLPAGRQRLGAALHLRRRRAVRGGAHGGPVPGGPLSAALSAGGRGAGARGWNCLETAAAGEGPGAGHGGGGGGRGTAEEPPAGNFWLCPARRGRPPGHREGLAEKAPGAAGAPGSLCMEGRAARHGHVPAGAAVLPRPVRARGPPALWQSNSDPRPRAVSERSKFHPKTPCPVTDNSRLWSINNKNNASQVRVCSSHSTGLNFLTALQMPVSVLSFT